MGVRTGGWRLEQGVEVRTLVLCLNKAEERPISLHVPRLMPVYELGLLSTSRIRPHSELEYRDIAVWRRCGSGIITPLNADKYLFNNTLNTFYLRLYGIRHMVKDHSDSEKGNQLQPHGLLFLISSKGSFI